MRGKTWKKLGIITVAAAFTCSVVLSGCRKTEGAIETSSTDKGNRLQIGLSFDSFVIERWIRERDVFVSTTKVLGAGVNVQNANGDVQERIEQIEYSTKKQTDVTAVVAGGCDTLLDVIKKAKDARIGIVNYDRLITNADCNLYISPDNEKVGWLMTRCFLEHVPGGSDIFMIQEPETDGNVPQIWKGFSEALAGSGLSMVYKANCGGWLAEYAFTYVKKGSARHRDVKDAMCGNDDLATQAFRALSEGRPAGKVVLTGQDGDLMVCQRIVEGTQNMTVLKSVEEEARLVAEYVVKLSREEKLTDITKTIDDDTYEVSCRGLVPIAMTGDSMDEMIIRGGLHAEEDVYLNVRK